MADRPVSYSEKIEGTGAPMSLESVRIAEINDPAERAREVYRANTLRLDSIAPGRGQFLARELEYAYQRTIEQVYTDLKLFSLVPRDSEVPEGAMVYKIKKEDSTGSAQYYRGNSNTKPKVGLYSEEELRPVRHIITGFEINYFEEKAAAFAQQNLRGRMERTARRVMEEFHHDKLLVGSAQDDVYGVVTYPFIPKTASTVEIGPNSVSNAEAQLNELLRLARINWLASDEKFGPDTMVCSSAMYRHIKETQIAFQGDTVTILEAFLKRSEISEVISLPHLKNLAPDGNDIILFMKRGDQESLADVVPKGFTMLPAEPSGSLGGLYVPCYMSHGGVRSWKPLNNLIVYTPTPN